MSNELNKYLEVDSEKTFLQRDLEFSLEVNNFKGIIEEKNNIIAQLKALIESEQFNKTKSLNQLQEEIAKKNQEISLIKQKLIILEKQDYGEIIKYYESEFSRQIERMTEMQNFYDSQIKSLNTIKDIHINRENKLKLHRVITEYNKENSKLQEENNRLRYLDRISALYKKILPKLEEKIANTTRSFDLINQKNKSHIKSLEDENKSLKESLDKLNSNRKFLDNSKEYISRRIENKETSTISYQEKKRKNNPGFPSTNISNSSTNNAKQIKEPIIEEEKTTPVIQLNPIPSISLYNNNENFQGILNSSKMIISNKLSLIVEQNRESVEKLSEIKDRAKVFIRKKLEEVGQCTELIESEIKYLYNKGTAFYRMNFHMFEIIIEFYEKFFFYYKEKELGKFVYFLEEVKNELHERYHIEIRRNSVSH